MIDDCFKTAIKCGKVLALNEVLLTLRKESSRNTDKELLKVLARLEAQIIFSISFLNKSICNSGVVSNDLE